MLKYLLMNQSDNYSAVIGADNIDAGTDTSLYDLGQVIYDYSNSQRPSSGIGYDIGAFEK